MGVLTEKQFIRLSATLKDALLFGPTKRPGLGARDEQHVGQIALRPFFSSKFLTAGQVDPLVIVPHTGFLRLIELSQDIGQGQLVLSLEDSDDYGVGDSLPIDENLGITRGGSPIWWSRTGDGFRKFLAGAMPLNQGDIINAQSQFNGNHYFTFHMES